MIHLIIWWVFTISTGVFEAILFHNTKSLNAKFKDLFKFDIHWLFVFIRAIHLTPLLFISNHWIVLGLFAVFTFPFLHDGFYYLIRKQLSGGKVYPKGWIDKSPNTTAKLSFNFGTRLVFFIFGVGLSILIILD